MADEGVETRGPGGSQAEGLGRQSFIVQVHPGGISTVENLRTRERIRIEKLAAIGPLVERWVAEAGSERRAGEAEASVRRRSEEARG